MAQFFRSKLNNRILHSIPWISVIIFSAIFIIFLTNSLHEEYPDEYDSILGGRYILEGKIPYRDWFQHHQPGAYIVASLILPFSGTSFVRFRLLLALAFFIINIKGYLLLKKRFPDIGSFYIPILFLIAISGTYFWGQMLLADTLAAYFILPAIALVVLSRMEKRLFTQKDLVLFSIFSFLSWFTSMTYTYLIGGLILYAVYLFYRGQRVQNKSHLSILARSLFIIGIPFVVYFLLIILTGSLDDYYFANITYNQRFYIYNYPRPIGAPVNPIRYAIIIAHDFFNNFFPLLGGVKDFRFNDPLNTTLALSQGAFFIVLLLTRNYLLILPFSIILIYANARSNPAAIRETDYQASVYILSSIFFGWYGLYLLRKLVDSGTIKYSTKIIASSLFLILVVYWFFTSFFLSLKYLQKFFVKYMGTAPLIYDRPEVAPIINSLTSSDDYVWVGPFEFKELWYLKGKVPSKYHWFLNHAASSPRIMDGMIDDFNAHKPKVIVFNRNYSPWGGDPKTFNYFFTDFLDQNYVRLVDINDSTEDFEYKWKNPDSQNFNLERDFNINKDNTDEMIGSLLSGGYIVKNTK